MSELITAEIFNDGQQNINAANMNGIIGRAQVQPDVILNKPDSPAMDVSDQFLVLKTDNTLARSRFDTIVNSTSSTLPVADTVRNGMLRQVSGKSTDVVDGTNHCVPMSTFLPAGVVVDYAGISSIPPGWLFCDGSSLLRSDYPDLFLAIGTTYGAVDSTHFSLPDIRGRITACAGGSYGSVLGANGGAAMIAISVNELPFHQHTLGNHTHGMDHYHSMSNHTHLGADHMHAVSDHTHNIPAGQFSHTHTYSTMGSGSTWSPGSGWSLVGGNTGASTLPAGVTAGSNQSLTTGLADRNLTTGGPSNNSTQYASETYGAWVSTTGPTGASDYTGNGGAFSILPPFQVSYKIIKY